jgi:hypothetical protein
VTRISVCLGIPLRLLNAYPGGGADSRKATQAAPMRLSLRDYDGREIGFAAVADPRKGPRKAAAMLVRCDRSVLGMILSVDDDLPPAEPGALAVTPGML